MLPQIIPKPEQQEELCALQARWLIHPDLAQRLAQMAKELPYPLQIISGWRSSETQASLMAEPDSTAASEDRSTHRTCPATGADVWTPTVTPVAAVKAAVGAAAMRAGLRWGGGGPVDLSTGIPKDWNHVDLGPRR